MGVSTGSYLQAPLLVSGKVVSGFQRGSKELGFPTANLEFASEEGKRLKQRLQQGVYCGYCTVRGQVYMMATSVGDNPYYGNEDVTIEVHVLNKFEEDFYGETVSCVLVDYVRKMTNFDTLDSLIAAIQSDCSTTREKLAEGTDAHARFSMHPFLFNPTKETAGDLMALM